MTEPSTEPSTEQRRYEVRFDWGTDGARAVATDADVLVWVDAIATPGRAVDPAADLTALPPGGAVIETSMTTAAAAARWVLELQEELRQRLAIAVVAAGEVRTGPAGAGQTARFAVEDLLAAGAVVEHLADLGLDACSPEAAAAAAAYVGLRGGVGHLLTACVTASATPPDPEATRVRIDLGPDAVTVRRDHPRRRA